MRLNNDSLILQVVSLLNRAIDKFQAIKNAAKRPRLFYYFPEGKLQYFNVFSLRAFLALSDNEFNFLAFR